MADNTPDNPDFLDEIISESTKRNPDFPELLEKAEQDRAAKADADAGPELGPIGTVIWEEALVPALKTAKVAAITAAVTVGAGVGVSVAVVGGLLLLKRR